MTEDRQGHVDIFRGDAELREFENVYMFAFNEAEIESFFAPDKLERYWAFVVEKERWLAQKQKEEKDDGL